MLQLRNICDGVLDTPYQSLVVEAACVGRGSLPSRLPSAQWNEYRLKRHREFVMFSGTEAQKVVMPECVAPRLGGRI